MLALVLLAGCSSGDGSTGGGGNGDEGATGDNGDRQPTPVVTVAEIGEVVGRLSPRKRERVLADVAEVVDAWLDAAFVAGDYPRTDFDDAFRGFTRRTARLASRDRAMSNAAMGDRVEHVEATRRRLAVDVFSPGNEPSGVTARVVLRMDLSGDIERTDRVRGRLFLTPTRRGWRVFGYDVARERVKAD